MPLSLYLHFPFCKRKCSYCDFCSTAGSEAEQDAYCRALETEIALAAKAYGHLRVDTVFLGGGTPSVIPAAQLSRVLDALGRHFSLRTDVEFSSEANPGTLRDDWLDAFTGAGGNRLSLGVQATQERLLRTLGRIHTWPEAREALAMARRHGIDNLNADAMFGLPGQTISDYRETLRLLAGEGVTHLSAYALIVEDHTPLARRIEAGEWTLPGEDETADMLEEGVTLLETLGYRRYEISNFAKPGFACRHNLGYWRQKDYLGLGLSAASRLPAGPEDVGAPYVRRTNTADLAEYLRSIGEGRLPVAEARPIPPAEAMFETVMLGLRTVKGVRCAEFLRLHGVRPEERYADAIARLTRDGLLQPLTGADPRLALTRRGLALQNTALMAFLPD